LQIALVLAPVLVLASQLFGLATFTLVLSPMLVVALVLAVIRRRSSPSTESRRGSRARP
jgi:Ca2+/H+ antiporter